MATHDERVSFHANVVRVGSYEWAVDYPVRDARLVGSSVVVVYDYMAGPRYRQFQNAAAFEPGGRWLWTAEHPTNETADAYVEIVEVDPLILWTFACYLCTVDPTTGKLLGAQFTK